MMARLVAVGHSPGMNNVRRLREERGLSQVKLAELAGVSQGTVSKLENGNLNITLDNIHAIAKALRVDPPELFDMPELKARAVSAVGAMTPEQAAAAIVVLEAMAGLKPSR